MSIKLRELIRSIRACKTAAEERAVVARECALIRTAFKEDDNQFRCEDLRLQVSHEQNSSVDGWIYGTALHIFKSGIVITRNP